MDLIELARTIQEDHRRQIERTTRTRRLMEPSTSVVRRNLPPAGPTGTTRSGQAVPSASTAR